MAQAGRSLMEPGSSPVGQGNIGPASDPPWRAACAAGEVQRALDREVRSARRTAGVTRSMAQVSYSRRKSVCCAIVVFLQTCVGPGSVEQSSPFDDAREGYPMAEVTPADQSNGQFQGQQLVVQKIYVKDVSFEVPNAPHVFQEIGSEEQPQVQLNLAQKATAMGNDLYEVVLSLTLTCTVGQRTAYLAEVQQAGLFGIAGFADSDRENIVGSYCPNLLFPYARQLISS